MPKVKQKNPVEVINALHGEVAAETRMSLEKARRIGRLLAAEKAKHPREWQKWLKANIQFSRATADNYLRVYERWEKLQTANVSNLREAYRVLYGSNKPKPNPRPKPDDDDADPPPEMPPVELDLTADEHQEFEDLVNYLMEKVFGNFSPRFKEETVLAALRFAREHQQEVAYA